MYTEELKYTEKLKELVNTRWRGCWSKEDTIEALWYLKNMFYNNEVDKKYLDCQLVGDLMRICVDCYSWHDDIPCPAEFYGEIVELILNYRLKMGIEVRG